MITRAYENAKGERQEISFPAEVWGVLSKADLDIMLGFGNEEEAVEAPAKEEKPAKVSKSKAARAAAE